MSTTPPVLPQSLIERAAESLYVLDPLFNRDGVPYTWQQLDTLNKKYKAKYLVQAIAALQSLGDEWCLVPRVPTCEEISQIIATGIIVSIDIRNGNATANVQVRPAASAIIAMLEAAHTQPHAVKE